MASYVSLQPPRSQGATLCDLTNISTPMQGHHTDSDVVHSFKGSTVTRENASTGGSVSLPFGLMPLRHEPSRAAPPRPAGLSSSKVRSLRAWRSAVPFTVPIYYPELECPETNLVHSATLKYTSDRGIRFLHVKRTNDAVGDTVSFQSECGITGMSLRKHCRAFAQSSCLTYPGLVQTSQVRRELELSRIASRCVHIA